MERESNEPVLVVIDQLVDCFTGNYEPCYKEWDADEVFTMGKLRNFFCAYDPKPGFVDPIGEYLRILGEEGFILQVTSDGMPAIFVNRKSKT